MGDESRSQLDLLGVPPAPPAEVTASAVSPELAALASKVPSNVRFGTSTWSYPGWRGFVYEGADRVLNAPRLAREGLPAYAQHPLLRAVGLDRTHYRPLSADEYAGLASQTPPGFRFVVKAHEACTLARWPRHARYGNRRGDVNERFLDAEYASAMVDDMIRGFDKSQSDGKRLGAILFQVAPQEESALGGFDAFCRRLQTFLQRLPPGPTYAVEVRNPELVSDELADALQNAGAIACLTSLSRMPGPVTQARRFRAGESKTLLVRWMVPNALDYNDAQAKFSPYDKLARPDVDARDEVARVILAAERKEMQALVIVNNLAEGSAPLSIRELVAHTAALRRRLAGDSV